MDPSQQVLVVSQHSATTQSEVHISSSAQTCTCPQGQLQYPCKHVTQIISLSTGETSPDIIKALGNCAGTDLDRFEQLQSEGDNIERKMEDFMLADDEPAQTDKASDAAHMVSAAAAANSSYALLVIREPDVNVAMSNHKRDELHQKVKNSSSTRTAASFGQPVHIAAGIVESLSSTSACGLAHPAAATLTQRQDGLNNSLVRLVSLVENPFGKRAKPRQTADSKADAVDALAPFAKPPSTHNQSR